MKRPRVLLADDHQMLIDGLRTLLADEFDVVGTVADGRELVTAAKKLKPDVIVADISMPHMNGLEAIARVKKDGVPAKVVFLTMHQDTSYARRALELGALGFVVKHSAPAELVMAVHAALKGHTFVTPILAGNLLQEAQRGIRNAHTSIDLMTERQREILRLFAEGLSAKEIGKELGISARTVEFHKYQIMDAHGLQSTAELVHFAIKNGIVAI